MNRVLEGNAREGTGSPFYTDTSSGYSPRAMEWNLPGIEIIEPIATGPVRTIFRARQIALNRAVLVIGLAPSVPSSSKLATSLSREAHTYARLDHPNIPRLYDFRTEAQQTWLVLEDSQGERLDQRFPAPLSWRIASATLLFVLRALIHARERGISHGRVSIDHVLITQEGRIQLSGFGLAPSGQSDEIEPLELTRSGGLSPEATLGQAPSVLGDLFACGALLYELLSGRKPFGPVDDPEHDARVRSETPEPLTILRPDIPAALDALVRHCLEKVPSRRPESLEDLAQRLEILLDEPPEQILKRALSPAHPETERPHPIAPAWHGRLHWLSWQRSLLLLGLGALLCVGLGILTSHIWLTPQATTPTYDAKESWIPEAEALSLRAVATPWAHVWVDGVKRETTPFAQPIRLSPGRHLVRFEHPNALAEEREIEGVAGENIFLDVVLRIERSPLPQAPLGPPPDGSP